METNTTIAETCILDIIDSVQRGSVPLVTGLKAQTKLISFAEKKLLVTIVAEYADEISDLGKAILIESLRPETYVGLMMPRMVLEQRDG